MSSLLRGVHGAFSPTPSAASAVFANEVFGLTPDRTLLTVALQVTDGGSTIALQRVFRPEKGRAY